MRAWGRVYDEDGTYTWTLVQTDAAGNNDDVRITQLIQVLLLNLGESPFYGDMGIPGQRSVQTQIPPDFYVALTQSYFAPFFASLVISKISSLPPTYKVNIITNQGVAIEKVVPR